MKNKLENCWIYKKKCLEVPPDNYYGFIYCITDDQGRFYWGKKAFTHRKKSALSKKARAGTRKRTQVKQVDSGWLSYWGSCKPLLEYIKTCKDTSKFKREIIYLCPDKATLTYYETKVLIDNEVLFRDDCWNGNILGRMFKNKITKL